jgi:hypothetical protein
MVVLGSAHNSCAYGLEAPEHFRFTAAARFLGDTNASAELAHSALQDATANDYLLFVYK